MIETWARARRVLVVGALAGAALLATPTAPAAADRAPDPVPTGRAPGGTRAISPGADSSVDLPFERSGRLAVDPGTARTFAAGDDVVAVLSPSLTPVATLTGLSRGTDVVAGGGSVWVLLSGTQSIARIDPVTLAVTTWAAPTDRVLSGLGFAGGKAWTVGAPAVGDSSLLGLDPVAGTWSDTDIGFDDQAILASSPVVPNTLVGSETDSLRQVDRWDVSSGSPVLQVSTTVLPNLWALAIGPDGSRLLNAEGGSQGIRELDLATLQPSGVTYPTTTGGYGVAATTANGGAIAATLLAFYGPTDTYAFRPGSPLAIQKAFMLNKTGNESRTPPSGAVAFSADGTRVLALSANNNAQPGDGKLQPVRLLTTSIVPTLTGLDPGVVGTRGGATVKVTGTALGATTAATAGGVAAPVTNRAGGWVTITAPALPAGVVPVTVKAGGTTASAPTGLRVAALGPFRVAASFVDRAFVDIVGRAPTAAELVTWTGRLATGTAPGVLPAGAVATPTLTRYRAPIIRLLAAADVSPSPATITDGAARSQAGTSLAAIGQGYATSRYGSMPTRNFVDAVHRNVLGRPATSTELTSWSTKLRTTTRGQMLVELSQSSANVTRTANRVKATELHVGLLRRAPTTAEATAATTPTDLATALLASGAYAARYPNG